MLDMAASETDGHTPTPNRPVVDGRDPEIGARLRALGAFGALVASALVVWIFLGPRESWGATLADWLRLGPYGAAFASGTVLIMLGGRKREVGVVLVLAVLVAVLTMVALFLILVPGEMYA